MTPKDRITQLIVHKQPADRVGLYEHYWPETIRDYWINEGYPDKDRLPADFFGYDLQSVWPITDPGPLKGLDATLEETAETRVFRNGYGAICRYWKTKSGTPEHLDFTIKTRQDWDRVRGAILDLDPSRVNLETARTMFADARRHDRFACLGFCFLIETMRGMIGDFVMLTSLLLEPDWIHDIGRVYTNFYKKHWAYIFDNVGRPDGVWMYEDLGFRNGLFASPQTLREMIFPYHKEIVDFFKRDYNLPVLIHTCGDIRQAVPLIIETGIDCLQPMEAKAGVDVLQLADAYGNKLAYMGNIDVTVLNQNDPAKVRQEVMRKMGGMIQRRMPYILHSDHSIPPDVRFETYRYMLDLHRNHGTYK